MMVSINKYYENTVKYCITVLLNSRPGRRQWTIDKVTGYRDYSLTERSTFPQWSKFFYEKKPTNWHLLTVKEQKLLPRYFCGNTTQLIKILKKSLTNKPLPDIQGEALEILFDGVTTEEEDFYEQYQEPMIMKERLNG